MVTEVLKTILTIPENPLWYNRNISVNIGVFSHAKKFFASWHDLFIITLFKPFVNLFCGTTPDMCVGLQLMCYSKYKNKNTNETSAPPKQLKIQNILKLSKHKLSYDIFSVQLCFFHLRFNRGVPHKIIIYRACRVFTEESVFN